VQEETWFVIWEAARKAWNEIPKGNGRSLPSLPERQMRKWWSSVSEHAKPIILGAATTVAIGLLAWFVATGVPAVIQWLYRHVIMRLDKAKRLISAEGLVRTGTFAAYISTDDIIKRSGVWEWLAKRAMRSETKRKMGLV